MRTLAVNIFILSAMILIPILFFIGNNELNFIERDEAYYAQTAREMLESGNYVVPYFNGQYQFKKPVFLYWVLTLAYRIFGINEFSVRFWPAVFALGSCLLIFFFVKAIFDKVTALFSVLILAVSPQFFVAAKFCTTDSILLFFISAALVSFYFIYQKGGNFLTHFCFYSSLAFSVLVKGPVGIILVPLIGLIFLALRKEIFRLKSLHLARGLLIFLAIVLPWVIAVQIKTNGLFGETIIFREILKNIFTFRYNIKHGFFYYFPVILFMFYPWSCFLPMLFERDFRKKIISQDRLLFVFIWAAVPLVLFSLIRTKYPHYLLPLYPALAILSGFLFKDFTQNKYFIWQKLTGKISLFLFVFTSIFLIGGLPLFFGKKNFFLSLNPAFLISLFLTFVLITGLIFWHLRKNRMGFLILAAGSFLVLFSLSTQLYSTLNAYNLAKPLARQLQVHLKPQDLKVVYKFNEPNLIFYLGGNVLVLEDSSQLQELISKKVKFYCVLPYSEYKKFRDDKDLTLLYKKRGYVLDKFSWVSLCLVTNKIRVEDD